MTGSRILELLSDLLVALIPVLAAFFWIRYLIKRSIDLTRTYYGLPENYDVSSLLFQRIFPELLDGLTRLPIIRVGKVGDLAEKHWSRWLGGPAKLMIFDGVALYLEKGSKFSRVVGPGLPMPFLERNETIKLAIDLRPQVVTRKGIKTWTKDGIEVQFIVRAEFQIASSDEARQNSVILEESKGATNLRFPYDAKAVKQVVESIAVEYNNETKISSERSWERSALRTTVGKIKAYIAGHSIDELLLLDVNSPQLSSFQVSNELLVSINESLFIDGSQILSLQIKEFLPVDQEISDKQQKYWEAKREIINMARVGETKAEGIRAKQRARTIAQQDLLNSLIENLDEINKDFKGIDPDRFSEASILLLTQIIDKSVSDPLIGTYIAREVLETLEILREQLDI